MVGFMHYFKIQRQKMRVKGLGSLKRNFQAKHNKPNDKPGIGIAKDITLSMYIRNCISHPENGNTYTQDKLKNSIELMKILIA